MMFLLDVEINIFFFNFQRREIEEQSTITCELCGQETANFNRHMKLDHPGCGGILFINFL